jgi:hypothetical protein
MFRSDRSEGDFNLVSIRVSCRLHGIFGCWGLAHCERIWVTGVISILHFVRRARNELGLVVSSLLFLLSGDSFLRISSSPSSGLADGTPKSGASGKQDQDAFRVHRLSDERYNAFFFALETEKTRIGPR